jgi:glucosyl-3-phosphoglycerate synthase
MQRLAEHARDDRPNERISRAAPATAAERPSALRSFHHSAFPASRIAAARVQSGASVSVCLPARECAGTVGAIVTELCGLAGEGLVDEVVVVDAASADGTASVAERAGARVLQEADLFGEEGPVLGKGDAMWRALPSLAGDVVCFIDADTEGFSRHFATGLLGPLLCEPEVCFVKGFYRRPLHQDGSLHADGGGRVNHLTARPALALFYPELAGVRQPLAGEVAARRELLERLPFATGYGVEIAMLIDAWREVGLRGIAQVDLDEHHNRHQPTSALAPMALTVLATIAARMERDGRLRAIAPGRPASPDALVAAPADGASLDLSAALANVAGTELAAPPPDGAGIDLAPPERPAHASRRRVAASLPHGRELDLGCRNGRGG